MELKTNRDKEFIKFALTEEEQFVVDSLVDAWNKFVELPVLHVSDSTEFMQAIHAAQNIVLSRIYLRTEGLVITGGNND